MVGLVSALAILAILTLISRVTNIEAAASFAGPAQNSLLGLQLSPNPTLPGSYVVLTGDIPGGSVLVGLECSISSSSLNIWQNCMITQEGSIMGRFEISPSATSGNYWFTVNVTFLTQSPNYGYCEPTSSTQSTTSWYGTLPSSGSYDVYSCQIEDDSLELTVSQVTITTTTQTSFITGPTRTQISITTSTSIVRVPPQITVPDLILALSATAAAATFASRVYAKRHPGFDVEVRTGIDQEKS